MKLLISITADLVSPPAFHTQVNLQRDNNNMSHRGRRRAFGELGNIVRCADTKTRWYALCSKRLATQTAPARVSYLRDCRCLKVSLRRPSVSLWYRRRPEVTLYPANICTPKNKTHAGWKHTNTRDNSHSAVHTNGVIKMSASPRAAIFFGADFHPERSGRVSGKKKKALITAGILACVKASSIFAAYSQSTQQGELACLTV